MPPLFNVGQKIKKDRVGLAVEHHVEEYNEIVEWWIRHHLKKSESPDVSWKGLEIVCGERRITLHDSSDEYVSLSRGFSIYYYYRTEKDGEWKIAKPSGGTNSIYDAFAWVTGRDLPRVVYEDEDDYFEVDAED